MILLKNFKDFLFDNLFENKIELTIVLSERLEKLLKKIDHEVSKELLELCDNDVKSDKITLIDYDDDEYNKFSYIIPNKLLDFVYNRSKDRFPDKNKSKETLLKNDDEEGKFKRLSRNTKIVWEIENRPSQSIGKVINKIFPGKFDTPKKKHKDDVVRNYIEEFTNLVILERKKEEELPFRNFKIVDGSDINYYYNKDSYESIEGSSSLARSCMRFEKCDDFIDFYSQNDGVEMVILMSDEVEGTIIGRALLWDISEIDGEKVNRKFLDRIYTLYDSDVNLFKDYAIKNGWLYKKRQISVEDEPIVDPINDTIVYRIKTTSTFDKSIEYPYLDTLKFYYHEHRFLTNYEIGGESYYKLESTRGNYEEVIEDNSFWSDYYDRYIYEDDEDFVYCEYGDDYRLPGDYYEVGGLPTIEYATKEYAEENLVYSEETDMYYLPDDIVWSHYHNSNIPKKESIMFYTNESSNKPFDEIYQNPHFIDYTMDDNKYIIQYYKHNMYFDIDEKDNFMFVKSLLKDGDKKVWVHKKWDRDKIFKMDGEYWINDSTDEDFYSLKGNIKLLGEKKI